MVPLKEISGKKVKINLEQACRGDGCITILPSSQDGTNLSREEFRDDLRWSLDLTFQDTPLKCDGFSDTLIVVYVCCWKKWGLIGL